MPQLTPTGLAFLLAYAAFGVWTARRLLPPIFAATAPPILRSGILRFGLPFWATFTVLFALDRRDDASSLGLRVLGIALIMFPLSLWAGHLWGTIMHRFFGSRGE